MKLFVTKEEVLNNIEASENFQRQATETWQKMTPQERAERERNQRADAIMVRTNMVRGAVIGVLSGVGIAAALQWIFGP